MKGCFREEESKFRKVYSIEQVTSRPKIDMVFHNNDKKLNIWVESIRGYIGASKYYHSSDMSDKIKRYKITLYLLSQKYDEAYCMVFVCQSYSNMKETAELVSSALDREWPFPVLLTYDMAVIGRFSESHFLLQPTGQLEKIRNVLEYFNTIAK
jgi:hypothetical protein